MATCRISEETISFSRITSTVFQGDERGVGNRPIIGLKQETQPNILVTILIQDQSCNLFSARRFQCKIPQHRRSLTRDAGVAGGNGSRAPDLVRGCKLSETSPRKNRTG